MRQAAKLPSAPHPFTRARHGALGLAVLVACGAAVGACDRSDLIEILGEVRPAPGGGPAPRHTPIPFTVFDDDVGDKGADERRVLFKTRDAYEKFFGHAPPKLVDFSREWVIFYAAGTKPSGGFRASVHALASVEVGRDRLLQAVTRLESPGRNCAVTDALTRPHVLIKFAAQEAIFNVDFSRADVTTDCPPSGEPTNPCAAILCGPGTHCVVLESFPPQGKCVPIADPCATVRCPAGTHCEAQEVQCVRVPCPPVAQCVKDPPRVMCGGIAGIKCPGAGTCVDDPDDSCRPGTGADCGGLCKCNVRQLCVDGLTFDDSPKVCACVPKK